MNKSPKQAKTPKDRAWAAMSQYIRTKECLETTGFAFLGFCFTCERRFHINYLEAGHCFGGRRNARLFDSMCIHNQCGYCNKILHGNTVKYKAKMIKLYGEDWYENRRIRGLRAIKDNQVDWEKLLRGIERMRDKLFRRYGYKTFAEILREKGE